jgi:hypothetical protein
MPPSNTSTDSYFEDEPTDKPDQNVKDDFESSELPKPEAPTRPKNITRSNNRENDVATVSKDRTPSPVVSDLVLTLDFDNFMVASNLVRQWEVSGFSQEARKAKLKALQDMFDCERAWIEKREEEKRRREYDEDREQYEGRGRGKKV